jgi:hypothetical protein
LFAFEYGTCGLTLAGEAYCWGYNAGGAFGRANIRYALEPMRVQIGSGITWIGVPMRNEGLCALNATAQLICWGGGY